MTYTAPFGTKERLKEYLEDFFMELPEGYDPDDVIDVIFESLDGWISYHQKSLTQYELVRSKLRERICST